jgi:hypothetical protein
MNLLRGRDNEFGLMEMEGVISSTRKYWQVFIFNDKGTDQCSGLESEKSEAMKPRNPEHRKSSKMFVRHIF